MQQTRAVAYTRVPTAGGRLQIFVGDIDTRPPRDIQFTLDGVAAQPVALRPLSSVRGERHGVAAGAAVSRAFAGTYEFRDLEPGRTYRVGIVLPRETLRLDARVLPEQVRSDADGGFDVLLSSCFYRPENSAGALTRAMRQLMASTRPKRGGGRSPDLALLMGDQVYLDLPTLKNFDRELSWLAARFEGEYWTNWKQAMGEVLGAAPYACLPDDHEFWNNAPHPTAQSENTWSEQGRRTWLEAATLNYAAFAKPYVLAAGGAGLGDATDQPLCIDVPPLSFFLADARSKRNAGRSFAFSPECRRSLRGWVERLNRDRRVGVFVCGQSLLRAAAGDVHGKIFDWELANYGDYREVLAELGRARQRLLLLTGDVHWGRVTSAVNRQSGAEQLQEVVVSPLSLVSTVGVDQAKLLSGFIRGIFGTRDQWPRHSDAERPPAELRLGSAALRCELGRRADGRPAQIKGNQLGLLSFDWSNGRLRAGMTYFPVHDTITAPLRVPLFDIAMP